MAIDTKETGIKISETASANCISITEIHIRASGKTTDNVETASIYGPMEIYIKGNGRIIKGTIFFKILIFL
jgi:hypothetical protein